jgi:hypothetical protein
MTVYDLRTQDLTVDDLFRLAAHTTIQVISHDGQAFVIEAAEDFDEEVTRLGQSQPFRAFLAERTKRREGSISLEEFERELAAEEAIGETDDRA